MDGEKNGKPYFLMDDLGVLPCKETPTKGMILLSFVGIFLKKTLQGYLLNNRYFMESKRVFFLAQVT